ncbi:MAG: calcium/sodium antiporter [Nanoarchaeota archaeon]
MVFIDIVIFIVSLTLLIISANTLVKSSSSLAKVLRVPEFIIGLTVVSVGTSIPELATSIVAAIKQNSEIITGTIIGSNIANIGLILGIASIMVPIELKKKKFSLDSIFLVFISITLFILSLDQKIKWTEGLFFLLLFIAYISLLIKRSRKSEYVHLEENIVRHKISFFKNILTILFSFAFLYLGAEYLVKSASLIASIFGISEETIALTMIAVGTSLPELFVTLSSARQHKVSILMGNIIGSNISNTLLIFGSAAVISPIILSSFDVFIMLPIMITVSLLLYNFIKTTWFSRVLEGVLFLFFYLIFVLTIILLAPA